VSICPSGDGDVLDGRLRLPPALEAAQRVVEQRAQGEEELADHGDEPLGELLGRDPLGLVEDDLRLGREPALFLLGEKLLVVDRDDEDAAAAADELRFEPEGLFDLGRQTGGPGEVVSNSAVVDSNVH